MPKKRDSKRNFNKKEYKLLEETSSNKKDADRIAEKKRENGNRSIVNKGKQDGKKTYFIYERKGARDPKKK